MKDNYDNDKSIKNKNEKSIKDKIEIIEMNQIIQDVVNKVDSIQNESSNKIKNKKNIKQDPLINTENIISKKSMSKEENLENKNDTENEVNLNDIKLENKEQIEEQNSESNININQEMGKKYTEQNEENSISIQSSYRIKGINDSKITNSNMSQKNQNLNFTQTSSCFNYLTENKNNFEIIMPCQEDNIILEPIEKIEKEKNVISKGEQVEYKSDKINDKNLIQKYISDIDINSLNEKEELKKMERKLEILLNNIRIKLGYQNDNAQLESVLEKYSLMLLDKIENKLNKNNEI